MNTSIRLHQHSSTASKYDNDIVKNIRKFPTHHRNRSTWFLITFLFIYFYLL